MTDASARNISLEEMDRHAHLHPNSLVRDMTNGTVTPRIMHGGHGVFVADDKGRRFLDGFGGLYCVNIGYGRTEVADAIYEQAKQLAYYHCYANNTSAPVARLADRVVAMAPGTMSKVYFGLGGSDGNETCIKIAWHYQAVRGKTEKIKIISRDRAYHGSGIISGGLTGLPSYHTPFMLPVGPILRTGAAHHYWGAEPGESETDFSVRRARELDDLITREGADTVCAMIAEPVMGSGGIMPPPEGYWPAIQAVLKKHDVLLIVDEVVCGFGRLGTLFGCQYYGIDPDLVTIAKGLTSAYVPMSGSLVSQHVYDVMLHGSDTHGLFAHGFTYSGHPVSAAAAHAALDIVEQENLVDNARTVGAYLQKRMHETFDDHPMVGEVRGVGLLAALEFVADKAKKQRFEPAQKIGPKLAAACLEEGLIARAMAHGDILGYAPPLVITEPEVDELVARTQRGVDKVATSLGYL